MYGWGMDLAGHTHRHKTVSVVGGDEHRQLEHFQRKKVRESLRSFPRRVFKSAVWDSAMTLHVQPTSGKMPLYSEVQ
jgi:hypothetical protein